MLTASLSLSPTTDDLWQRACQVEYQPIVMPQWQEAGIEVWMRRDDQIDTAMSGNKFYKLFYVLQQARAQGIKTLVSFGGPHSNHLYALAAAGRQFGFHTRGIIRGNLADRLTETLKDVQEMGMQLEFASREEYRNISKGPALVEQNTLILPEGGDSELGQKGAAVIARATEATLQGQFTALCLAVGTGATLAGVATALTGSRYALGISTLKQGASISSLARHLPAAERWRLIWGFHGGGYGKKPGFSALRFWREFEQCNRVLIEPIYTLKMLQAIAALATRGYWPRGSRIIAVHTGGLQGRRDYAPLLQIGE